jgi:hypothetical protein
MQFIFIALMALPDVVCSNVTRNDPACFVYSFHRGSYPLFGPVSQPRTFFLKPTVIPLKYYLYQAALFFSMSYLNNVVFNFHVSQPVHVVVRSSNLVITCILGGLLGKSYESLGGLNRDPCLGFDHSGDVGTQILLESDWLCGAGNSWRVCSNCSRSNHRRGFGTANRWLLWPRCQFNVCNVRAARN